MRTRRHRRGGVADRVERTGHAVLTFAWSSGVWLIAVALGAVARAAGGTWRWFERREAAVQIAVLAAAAGGVWLAVRVLPAHWPRPPVYLVDESEALARVIRSEAGISSMQQRVHIAWATRNLAASRGQTIAEMACSPCGEQERGRPVSSRQEATDADRVLARHVLASAPLVDPTGGAMHFINPALQDELARSGRPGYRGRPYPFVRRIWTDRYRWEPYYRLGGDLELWGPRRSRDR